jgi:hypothetical protein
MPENYVVKQGDCISSIAFEKGFFPDTLWNHPNNKDLKEKRKDPNVLLPGDVVHVPDKRLKEVSHSTNQVHKFKVKNVPANLIVFLRYGGEPLKNEPYTLDIDGKVSEGKTDNEGRIRVPVIPNAEKGKLVVGEPGREINYTLDLANLDPIDEVIGFKKRLQNLGYSVGKVDNTVTPEFESAIRFFEAENKLEPTGEINETNKSKLKELYGR